MRLRGACSKCHQAREERNSILCVSALNELLLSMNSEVQLFMRLPGETERERARKQ